METFSILGGVVFMAIPGIGIGALLARKRKWKMFKGWSAALVGGPLIENILKWSIRRPRPEFAAPFLHGFSYSFPSGHALNSTIVYGMLTYILVTVCTRRSAAKVGIVIFFVLLVLGIGFSRLYLGVHYLSDVLGGFAVGIVWLATCIVFTDPQHLSSIRNFIEHPERQVKTTL
jgi:membrane-associated phospholipid phosphatase